MSTKHMTEKQKALDTENYILNPTSGRYVKKNSVKGKLIVAAEAAIKVQVKFIPKFVELPDKIDTDTTLLRGVGSNTDAVLTEIALLEAKEPHITKSITEAKAIANTLIIDDKEVKTEFEYWPNGNKKSESSPNISRT
jgi:hypothetical protein